MAKSEIIMGELGGGAITPTSYTCGTNDGGYNFYLKKDGVQIETWAWNVGKTYEDDNISLVYTTDLKRTITLKKDGVVARENQYMTYESAGTTVEAANFNYVFGVTVLTI